MATLPVASVARSYCELVRLAEIDEAIGIRPPDGAYGAVRAAAALRDTGFFRPDALPPVLLHTSGRANANWLYGGTRTSPVADAAYKPGKFDHGGQGRHQRLLLGAAFLQANDQLAIPALLYQLNEPSGTTVVAHVFSAPLAELEAQLVDSERPVTPFEKSLHGGEALAEEMRTLRVATGAYMREQGLAALPGFLISGDYHLQRPGLVAMLHLRAPETDLELEILERVCMTAMQHLPGTNPCPIGAEPLERIGATKYLAVFDRCADEFEFLNRKSEEEMNEHYPAFRDVKGARWAEASQMARRQVVVPLAAGLVEHGAVGLRVEACHIATVTLAAQPGRAGLEEASEMARAADVASLKALSEPPLSELLGMCPGASRLRRMAASAYHHDTLVTMTNQVFANAVDAELAARDVDPWKQTDTGGTACTIVALCRVAERVEEPNAMLVFQLGVGHTIRSIQLIGSAINQKGVGLSEAARLLSFPWVVPVAVNESLDLPHGMLTIEQPRVVRDKLRVTAAVRLRFGALPKPAASPEDLAAFKREVSDKLQAFAREMGALTATLNAPTAPIALAAPPDQASTREKPCSATSKVLSQTVAVLDRLMRKRGVAALSMD